MLSATNIITVAASADLPHRTVISERNDPSKQRLESPWQDLLPVLYPAAGCLRRSLLIGQLYLRDRGGNDGLAPGTLEQ